MSFCPSDTGDQSAFGKQVFINPSETITVPGHPELEHGHSGMHCMLKQDLWSHLLFQKLQIQSGVSNFAINALADLSYLTQQGRSAPIGNHVLKDLHHMLVVWMLLVGRCCIAKHTLASIFSSDLLKA